MSKTVAEIATERRMKREEEVKLNKENQNNFNFSSSEREFIEWMGITTYHNKQKTKEERVMRIVGNPFEVKENSSDAKLILFSEWLNDDGKGYIKLNWPIIDKNGSFKPDPDWILTKLYNEVNKGGWGKYTEEMMESDKELTKLNGEIVNRNKKSFFWKAENIDKTCHSYIVDKFNQKQGDQYSKQIYPSKRVFLNVIDRHDNWCIENKKTKVLSSRTNVYNFTDDTGKAGERVYADWGVPMIVYTGLHDNILAYKDHWNVIDTIIRLDNNNNYIIRDASEEKISDESKRIASIDPLTDEEKEYKLWDFDDYFKITSYYTIKKNLIKRFKQTDIDLGTHFEEELNDLVSKEAVEWKEEKKNRESQNITQVVAEINEVKEDKKEEVVQSNETDVVEIQNVVPLEETSSETRQSRKVESEINDYINLSFWKNLESDDVKDIKDNMISFNNNEFQWNSEAKLLPCKCGKELPSTVLNCPHCGRKFESH